MLYALLVIILKLPIHLLMRPKIYGNKGALRMKGGVIFIANHRTLFDPVMLAVCTPRMIHFMAKKELFETKIGNFFFKQLLVFPVSRKSADIKSLRQALKLLEEGKAFGIFPEGTRSITEGMDEFEKGTAFIAIKSGAPIVPVYISPKSYSGFRLKIMVGDPILADEIAEYCDKKQLMNVLSNVMQNTMEGLRCQLDGICR